MTKIMDFFKNKKNLIFISLVICVIVGVLLYDNFSHVIIIDNEVPQSSLFSYNEVGNANYFNPNNGKYYSDDKFQIEANDNTGYLVQLFESEGSISIPEGNFLCKTKLVIKGNDIEISGVQDKTKIIFSSYNFYNYGRGALAECIFSNLNHENEYNEKTAQSFKLKNIIFEYKRTTDKSPKTMALFRNVNDVTIDNCEFIADYDNEIQVTNLDLYSGCKNVLVTNSNFINYTNAKEGGCIWVRNLTASDVEIEGNNTENIIIENCNFNKDSGDEVIAIFASRGNVNNVIVRKCNIKDYSDKIDLVLSVFSSGNQYYGKVSDVTFEDNNIFSTNFNAFLMMIGTDGRENEVKNVNLTNNSINVESKKDKKKFIINVGNGNVNGVRVEGNIINAKNLSNSVAIRKAHFVKNNTITGDLSYGITGGEIIDNKIDGAAIAIASPTIATGNIITNCKIGISAIPGQISIHDNKISLNEKSGSGGIEIKGNYTGDSGIDCSRNEIITKVTTQFGFLFHNGNINLVDNNVFGPGEFMYSTRETIVAFK